MVPDYDPKQGYELAGFVWFQGFNDLVSDWTYRQADEARRVRPVRRTAGHLIRDVRKDLSAPKMPFVIGVMGIGGVKEGKKPPQMYFRQAQAAPASLPEFKGNVVAVETAPFWDDDLDALQQRMERLNDEAGSGGQEGPEADPGGEGRGAQEGHRGELHAGGVETPEGRLQRRLPLPRRRQDPGADRQGVRRGPRRCQTRPGRRRQAREGVRPGRAVEHGGAWVHQSRPQRNEDWSLARPATADNSSPARQKASGSSATTCGFTTSTARANSRSGTGRKTTASGRNSGSAIDRRRRLSDNDNSWR